MKSVLTALLPGLFATPLLAHSGAHMHPHSIEGWIVGLGILVLGCVAAIALKARK